MARLGFPRRRRPRLPDHGPHERDAVGRRGAADPARDPDRHDADGCPVHPRRAVDRPPPARQREAHRDAHATPRPRQHRARRRARRGDDPDRRLGRRHRPRGGGARRRDHLERHTRGAARRAALDHRRVPARRARGPDPEAPAQGQRQEARVSRGAREHNLRDIDSQDPARDVRVGDRGQRQRQEHARDRGPLPRAGARAQRVARARR